MVPVLLVGRRPRVRKAEGGRRNTTAVSRLRLSPSQPIQPLSPCSLPPSAIRHPPSHIHECQGDLAFSTSSRAAFMPVRHHHQREHIADFAGAEHDELPVAGKDVVARGAGAVPSSRREERVPSHHLESRA